jgi:ABC-type branched-subunit amino acid transport system ATPase component
VAVLAVNEMSTGYGPTIIVHNVSLQAHAGEIVTIIGPNGAGKSTFIKGIAAELKYTGRVELQGKDVTGRASQDLVRDGLGYVPQIRDVFPSLTVSENLEIGGYMMRKKEVRERRDDVLERFPPLKPAVKRQASTLSGGERKMLAIGRVLMANPRVVLLDEPSAGLSPQYTRVVHDHIVELAKEGRCIVMVEQRAIEALRMADRAYLLVSGRIRYEGSSTGLLEDEDMGRMFLGA